MTNNDELAIKLKAAAEKASGGEWVKEGGAGWQAIASDDDQVNGGFIICSFQGNDDELNREFVQGASPANILALLAERDADKAEIEKLRVSNRILASDAMCKQERIAELEARTVSVKLPESVIDEICLTAAEIHNLGRGVSDERAQEIIDSIRFAAGIKLEVGE